MNYTHRTFLAGLRVLAFLPLFFLSIYVSAQVTVTAATGGESMCFNQGPTDSDLYNLDSIIITENADDDIWNSDYLDEYIKFIVSNPDYQFKNNTGTLLVTGAEVITSSLAVNGTSIVVTIKFAEAAKFEKNVIIISGLQVFAKVGSVSADIIRVASGFDDLPIDGDDVGDLVSHGSLNAYNPPVASIVNDKGSDICTDELIKFTGSPPLGDNYKFILDPSGSRFTLQNGPLDNYSTSDLLDNDEVSVIVTDANGCIDESSGQTINVNAGFSAMLTSDVGNTSCQGEEVIFTAAETPPSGGITYEFFVNDLSVQAASIDDTYNVSTLADGDEIYAIVRDGSCAPTTNTITQTVFLPDIGLSVTPLSSTIGSGSSANLIVGMSELNVEYQLQNNGDSSPLSDWFLGTGSDLVLTSYALFASVTIKVVASSTVIGSCSSTLSDVEPITITGATPPPSASNPSPICENGTIPSLTASGTDLKWYDDITLVNQVGSGSPFIPGAPEVDNTTAGTYTLYVTQTISSIESTGTPVDVVVLATPFDDRVVTPASIDICENTTTTITVETSENSVNYQLLNNADDAPLSGVYAGNGGNLVLTTNSLSADVTIKVRATNASLCTSDLTNMTAVTIDFTPTTAAAGDDIEQCSDGDFTMAATEVTVGTGTWSVESGTATITGGEENLETASITGVPLGTSATLRWTSSNGVCTDSFDDVILTNNEQPVAAAGDDKQVCGLTFNLEAVRSVTGSDGTWTTTASPVGSVISFGDDTYPTSSVTVDMYGTYDFEWQEDNGICTDTDVVQIRFDETPTTAAAGSDIEQCSDGDFTMTATAVTVGMGTWSVESGTATITGGEGNLETASITGVPLGTSATLRWTSLNGVCAASFDDVILTNNEQPVAAAGDDSQVCGLTFNLEAVRSVTGSDGTWTTTASPGGSIKIFGDETSPTSSVTVDMYGTYDFEWQEDNGTCNDTDVVQIRFYETPTTAAAGSDIEQCDDGDFTMAATAVTVGAGAWSVESGTATITGGQENSETASITGVPLGTSATLRWTSSNGVCTDSFDDLILTNNEQPVAAAGDDNQVCGLTYSLVAIRSVTGSTGIWTTTASPGGSIITFGDETSRTSSVTVDMYGTYDFEWQEDNGICTDTDVVQIRFDETPTTADAGSDIEQCDDGNFTMAATAVTIGMGTWSVESGTATITGGQENSETASITGVPLGTSATLRWTSSNGVCSDSFDDVILINNEQPVAAAGDDNQVCGLTYSLIAIRSVTGSTGTWTTTASPGGSIITFGDETSPTSPVTVDMYGTYDFQWQEDNGTCNDTDVVQIRFDETPTTADAGSDIEQCDDGDFTMAATAVTVGTGTWSVESGTATITGGQENSETASITGVPVGTSATLRWTSSNGVCSDSFDDVILINNEQPVAAAGDDNQVCGLTYNLVAIRSVTGSTGTWTTTASPGGSIITFGDETSRTSSVTVDIYGTYDFEWQEDNGICTDTDVVQIRFDESPTTAAAGSDIEQCDDGDFTMAATAVTVGTGTWSVESGTATITGGQENSETASITGVPAGTSATLRWTSSNGVCSDSFDDVVLTNTLQTIVDPGISAETCEDTPYTVGDASVSNYASMLWTHDGIGSLVNATTTSPKYTPVAADAGTDVTLTLTVVGNGSCGNTVDTKLITITAAPTAFAGTAAEICDNEPYTVTDATATNETSILWSHDGLGSLTDETTLSPAYTPVSADGGNVVTLTMTVTGNGSCANAISEKTIQVNPIPVFTIVNNPADPATINNGEKTNIDIQIPVSGGTVSITDVTLSSINLTGYSPIGTIYSDGFKLENVLVNNTNDVHWVEYEFTAQANGCINPITQSVKVFVNPAPSMSVNNIDPDLCSGENTDIVINSLTADAEIELISITVDPDAGAVTGFTPVGTIWELALGELPATITDNLVNGTNDIQNITYEFEVSVDGIPETVIRTAVVTVNPTPTMAISNSNTTINSGTAIDIIINTPTQNGQVTLKSVVKTDPVLVGNTPVGSSFPDGTMLDDVLLNISLAPHTITYEFEVSGNDCVNPTTILEDVVVNPAPEMSVINDTPALCSGDMTDIEVNSVTANSIIELVNVSIGPDAASVTGYTALGTTWESALAELPLTIADNLVNSTDNIQTITYEFEVSASGFIATTTLQAVVIVNPTPTMTITNTKSTINSGATTDILLVTPTENGQVMLKSVAKTDPGLIGNTLPGTSFPDGSRLEDVLLNSTYNPHTITYEFEVAGNGCSDPTTITENVTVNPAPEMTVTNNVSAICLGETTDIEVNSVTADAKIELIGVTISPDAGGVTGYTVLGTTWDSGLAELPATIADNLVNSTNNIQTITYEFEVSASGFVSTFTATVDVTVYPTPTMTITNSNSTINSSGSTDILINIPIENGQVALKSVSKTDPSLTGNTGAGALFPDGTRLEDVLLNSNQSPETITYEFEARGNGCVNPATITVDVVVNPTPEISVTNNVLAVCLGETTDIVVNSITADSKIELIGVTISPDAGGVTGYTAVGTTWEVALSELPATIADNLVNTTNNIQTITYEFEVNASGFVSTFTETAAIAVNPAPTMTITNLNTTVNNGSITDILINTPTENGQVALKDVNKTDPGLTGNTGIGVLFPDGTRLEDVLLNATDESQTLTYEFEARGNGCVNTTSITADVGVVPLAEMTLANNLQTFCSSENTDITLSSPTVGAIIELVSINVLPESGSVTGYTPINTTWNTLPSTISDVLINSSNAVQTVEYVFSVTVGGFTNPDTQSVFIDVKPIPDIAAIGGGICSMDVTDIDIWDPSGVSFSVFNWVTSNTGVIAGESDGSGNKISQQLTNGSAALDSVIYKVYSTAQSCVGDSIEVVQYVHPRNIAMAGSDTTVCQGTDAINIETASIGGSATDIVWTKLSGNGVLSNVNALIPTYTPATNPTEEIGTINLQLTASDTSVCPSISDIVSIIINSKPVVEAGADLEICEGENVLLSQSLIGGSASLITWIDSTGLGTFLPNENTLNATFIPHASQVGMNVKLYITTNDPVGPCTEATDSLVVSINEAPIADAGNYSPVCIGDTIVLNASIGGSASSGVWSGGLGTFLNPNLLNTAYIPAAIEQGSDVLLTLTTDDPAGVCFMESSQTLVTVNKLPLTNFDGLSASYQVDDNAVILTGFPEGGIFSGQGVIDNTFSPDVADTGTHVIRYTYTDNNSCINFADETTVVNPLPDVEIPNPGPFCLNEDPIDNPLPRTAKPGFEDSWSGDNVFEQDGEYYFNHPVAGVGQHDVLYTIEDLASGAVSSEPRIIRVNDVPIVDFTTLNNCIAESIYFIDLSELENKDVFNDNIIDWEWKIVNGEETNSDDQNPVIKFDNDKPDQYSVRLTVTTENFCTAFKSGEVEIGAVPDPKFTVKNLTFGQTSEFTDATNIFTQSNDPTQSIDSIWWNFGEGNPVSGSHTDLSTSYHQFSQGNIEYNVSMKIKTNLGCYATDSTGVFVVKSINEFPYKEDFNGSSASASGGINPSWSLMVPNQDIIKGSPEDTAWVTSNESNQHNNGENSYVSLPAFDLRSLNRPMLSIDIWSDAENTRDGAALQYSYDGNTWKTLVDPNENITSDPKEQIGLNWYNEKGLVSRPGDGDIEGTSGDNSSGFGWTGSNSSWKTACFPLDNIRDGQEEGPSSVRFRVVFSSYENPVGTEYGGFAFDNLWIIEREHKVLFEHFDNLNNGSKSEITNFNSLANRFPRDLIPIQYHSNNPSEDIIYKNNKYPAETRGSIYDISETPRSFMDGKKEYDYSKSLIEDYQIINRALEDPKFDIDIDVTATGNGNSVDISVTITARDTLNEKMIAVNVLPVETSIDDASVVEQFGIDSLNNVVKDMIPPGGYPYNLSWSKGMSQNFTVSWDINKLKEENIIYDNTNLGVVVFVQNDKNEEKPEVYQAAFEKLPELQKTVVLSLEDELDAKKFENANIYPNPAQNYINVSLSDKLTKDLDWSVYDQRGVELLNGTFKAGEDSFEIDVKSLSNGFHIFIATSEMDYRAVRKIIVQH